MNMNLLNKKLGSLSGGRILDVATSDGGFIRKLIDAFDNYESAVGVDIDDKHFSDAHEKFKNDPVTFSIMDGAGLSFEDNSFETVSMCAGLHHLPDIRPVLSEMYRVLKPGGFFILREMTSDGQSEKQMSDEKTHHWAAKIHRIMGEIHNPTLSRQAIIDHVEDLRLSEYETGIYTCHECDPEKDGKMERELADLDKELTKVEGHPEYGALKAEAEQIRQFILTHGFACASCIDVIGIK